MWERRAESVQTQQDPHQNHGLADVREAPGSAVPELSKITQYTSIGMSIPDVPQPATLIGLILQMVK